MARMFNPPHPGLTLRDDVLPALGLTVTQGVEAEGSIAICVSETSVTCTVPVALDPCLA